MTGKGIAKKAKQPVKQMPAVVSDVAPLAEDARAGAYSEEQPGMLRELWRDPVMRIATLVVFACTFWQVFTLGFYLDDWQFIKTVDASGPAFSGARWHAAYDQTRPRPGETPLWFVLTSLFGGETLLWQLALFVANVFVVWLLFKIVRDLAGDAGSAESKRMLYLGVLLWFVLPWNATFHFWPTDVPILILAIVFLACLQMVLRHGQLRTWGFCLGALGYLWCCTGYEAFYFQWITAALFGLTLVLDKRAGIKQVLLATLPLVVGQTLAVVWFLMSRRINSAGIRNHIVPEWPKIFLSNLHNLPFEVNRSTYETKWLFMFAAAVWLLVVAHAYISALFGRRSDSRAALVSIARIAVCVVGALLSIFAFSIGGRYLIGIGVETRVFLLVSLLGVAAFALASTFCWTYGTARGWRWQMTTLLVAVLVGGSALLVGHLRRAFDWAEAWRMQQQIVAEAPIDEMKKMESGAAVLAVKPFEYNGVPDLSQAWDMQPAMWFAHPVIKGHHFDVYNGYRGAATWIQGRLRYQDDPIGVPFGSLYIWRPFEHEFFKATDPLRIDQDLSIHSLR